MMLSEMKLSQTDHIKPQKSKCKKSHDITNSEKAKKRQRYETRERPFTVDVPLWLIHEMINRSKIILKGHIFWGRL